MPEHASKHLRCPLCHAEEGYCVLDAVCHECDLELPPGTDPESEEGKAAFAVFDEVRAWHVSSQNHGASFVVCSEADAGFLLTLFETRTTILQSLARPWLSGLWTLLVSVEHEASLDVLQKAYDAFDNDGAASN